MPTIRPGFNPPPSSGAHNLLSKVDQSLVAYLIAKGAGSEADVFPAKRSLDKDTLPITICWSERGVETEPYSGTYTVQARVEVRSVAAIEEPEQDPENPKQTSDQRVAATFDAFHVEVDDSGEKLGDLISVHGRIAGAGAISLLNVKVLSVEAGYDDQHGRQYHGACWVDAIVLEIVCCPGNVLGIGGGR